MDCYFEKCSWDFVQEFLDSGEILILDGATGTEIEKHGGKMDEKGWSCVAQFFVPDIVRKVHLSYLQNGSNLIIANTYATNANVTGPAGYSFIQFLFNLI